MRIVAISDTHMGHEDVQLPEGDVLIHAGDATFMGTVKEVSTFAVWMRKQKFKHKIFVAGNHDWLFETHRKVAEELLEGIIYLQDSGTEIEGIKFWGTPWQPEFNNWAFNQPRGWALEKYWNKIPLGTDILISHGPVWGILDNGLGDVGLRKKIALIKPLVHICGHIHGGYGFEEIEGTAFVNASVMNEAYEIVNKPVVIDM